MDIIELFPTIIGKTKLDRDLFKYEEDILMSHKMALNYYNESTENGYVLNNENLNLLKNQITEKCQEYIEKIYKPNPLNQIKVYVTQSWVNFTKKDQSHHPHKHPNSFISGVLYLTDDEIITFSKSDYKMIHIVPQEWTKYNSSHWDLSVNRGDLVLFSSDLEHYVPKNEKDTTRVSLSFNTFLSGNFGSNDDLTELQICNNR